MGKGIFTKHSQDTKLSITVQGGVARASSTQLKGISLFKDCPDSFLEDMAAKFQSENYAKGEKVINKGDAPDKFYILAEGEAQVSDLCDQNDKMYLARLTGGEPIGEIALLRGTDRTANVEAVTDCIFLTLNRQDFLKALDATPRLREIIEKTIMHRERNNKDANVLRILRL